MAMQRTPGIRFGKWTIETRPNEGVVMRVYQKKAALDRPSIEETMALDPEIETVKLDHMPLGHSGTVGFLSGCSTVDEVLLRTQLAAVVQNEEVQARPSPMDAKYPEISHLAGYKAKDIYQMLKDMLLQAIQHHPLQVKEDEEERIFTLAPDSFLRQEPPD